MLYTLKASVLRCFGKFWKTMEKKGKKKEKLG